jgi:type VI secretion system secreted protein Hcp
MPFKLFLKIDGLKTRTPYKEGILLEGCRWGLAQQDAGNGGAGIGRGKVVLQDFHFIKPSDETSPELVSSLVAGKAFSKFEITAYNSNSDRQEWIYKLTLGTAQIAGMYTQAFGDGSVRPTEEFVVKYQKFDVITPPFRVD